MHQLEGKTLANWQTFFTSINVVLVVEQNLWRLLQTSPVHLQNGRPNLISFDLVWFDLIARLGWLSKWSACQVRPKSGSKSPTTGNKFIGLDVVVALLVVVVVILSPEYRGRHLQISRQCFICVIYANLNSTAGSKLPAVVLVVVEMANLASRDSR